MNDEGMLPGNADSFFYIEENGLAARFPDVHTSAGIRISFQRTLRVPDDGKVYPLPAGRERFPLWHLEDFAQHLPRAWRDRCGVIMPMHRSEAMWIELGEGYPCAIKIGAGGINVLNGRPWTERLGQGECDYIAAPPQPALDGFRMKQDTVRQFVAVHLGKGYTPEEQITGEAKRGGIQIVVHPMKRERFEAVQAENERLGGGGLDLGWGVPSLSFAEGALPPDAMALGAGGRMRDRLVADPYGIDAWDQSARIRCVVTLIDVGRWRKVTPSRPMLPPLTREAYEQAGVPWFDYDADHLQPLTGVSWLGSVKSIDEFDGRVPNGADGDLAEPGEITRLRPVLPPRRSRDPRPSVRALWTALTLFRR